MKLYVVVAGRRSLVTEHLELEQVLWGALVGTSIEAQQHKSDATKVGARLMARPKRTAP